MASSSEVIEEDNPPTPNEGGQGMLLQGAFHIKGPQYDVELLGAEIRWAKNGRKDTSKFEQSVTFDDVISLTLEEEVKNTKQNKGQPENSFTLHYITKHPKNIWKADSTCYSAVDGATRDNWVEKIKEILQVKLAHRPKRLLVYVNPVSGKKQGVKIYERHAAPLFQLATIETDVLVTTHAKHITKHVQDYKLDTIDGIVCVGGDGTYTECTNGIMIRLLTDKITNVDDPNVQLEPSHIPVGIIPSGTGQGQIFYATGAVDPITSVLHIIKGHTGCRNVLSVHNGNHSMCFGSLFCAYGFHSEMIEYSESHRNLGRFRYLAAMVNKLKSKKLNHVEVHYLPCQTNTPEEGAQGGDLHGSKGDDVGAQSGPPKDSMSIERSVMADGWKKIEGHFFDVNCYLEDITGVAPSGVLNPHIFTRATTMGILKHFKKLFTFKKDAYDFDWIESVEPSQAYRIVIKDFNKAEEAEGATNTCFNIDGEAFQLTEPVVHVRIHVDVLKLYGAFPPRPKSLPWR